MWPMLPRPRLWRESFGVKRSGPEMKLDLSSLIAEDGGDVLKSGGG
jgi:hypothetical protein